MIKNVRTFRTSPSPADGNVTHGRNVYPDTGPYRQQGCGISEGKFGDTYQRRTNVLQVAAEDMQRLGLGTGTESDCAVRSVRIELPVVAAKGDELPRIALHPLRRSFQSPDGSRYARIGNADQQGTGCGA